MPTHTHPLPAVNFNSAPLPPPFSRPLNRWLAGAVAILLCAGCASVERYDDQPVSSVPAVAVLVAGARDSALDKDYEKAADRLERALRIEPANPRIWHELALVYFARGDFQQAIQFARKSNTLTADSGLISRNTRLIAQAGERQKTSD